MTENNRYNKKISLIYYNIQYYRQMIALSTDPYHKMFYENLLNHELRQFNDWQWYHYQQPNSIENRTDDNSASHQRDFTLEELSQYDGSGGAPAYVAVDGIVYDVSLEATWGGGTHFSLYAGKDLTAQFNGCHDGRLEILKSLPQVGMLKE